MSALRKNRTKQNILKHSIVDKMVQELQEREKEALALRPKDTVVVSHDVDEEPGQLDLFDYVANTVHQYKVHKDVERQFEGLLDNLVRYDEVVRIFGMNEAGYLDGKKLKEAIREVIFTPGNVQGLANKYIPNLPEVFGHAAEHAAEINAQATMQLEESLPVHTAEGVINHV